MFTKEEKSKQRKMAANKIVEHALQIARLRAFGSHINSEGVIEHIGGPDVKMHIEGYEMFLKKESDLLLLLMTRDGVPMIGDPS